MNTLPKKLNRWMILAGVVVLSLILTFVVASKNFTKQKAPVSVLPTVVPTNNVLPTNDLSPVSVSLKYDYTGGFVDVFVTNANSVDNGQLLFKMSGDTGFTKIEDNSLFEKYFTSTATDKTTKSKTLSVGATKGIEGATVIPGNNQKFARIYFSNLKENSVMLDTDNSSFFVGTGNPLYKVVLGN